MTKRAYQVRNKGALKGDGAQHPFYPNHVLRGLMVVAAAVALIAFLSAIFPPSLDRAADPLTGPDPEIKVVWIIKPAIMAVTVVGSPAFVSSVAVILLFGFVLLPLFDRTGQRQVKKRLFLAIPLLILIIFFTLSILLHSGGLG